MQGQKDFQCLHWTCLKFPDIYEAKIQPKPGRFVAPYLRNPLVAAAVLLLSGSFCCQAVPGRARLWLLAALSQACPGARSARAFACLVPSCLTGNVHSEAESQKL